MFLRLLCYERNLEYELKKKKENCITTVFMMGRRSNKSCVPLDATTTHSHVAVYKL